MGDTMKQSRTYLTKRNAAASIVNRVVCLACNFIGRSVFIRILGSEYLGAGGMFGNVFAVLSLVELGFGEAVSQSLYQPLAEENHSRIRDILAYYAKVYRYISLVTIALCTAIVPFLPHIFGDIEKIHRYRAVYLLFAVHQVLSYYFAPKRSLVQCDQRMYAVMTVRTVNALLVTAAQIFFLIGTRSYLIYIFLRILFLAADGWFINLYADRIYPFLSTSPSEEVDDGYKKRVWSGTRSLVLHRIGGVINSSTDSILISSHLGLAHMGTFSNYSLVINSIGSFVALAIGAASASIGNIGATEGEAKSVRVLKNLSFANFILLTNCAVLLVNLINPFMALWLGEELCFGMTETAVIIACFYMSYIRDPVQMYLHSYGVFKSTGVLYLARGLLNLILSLIFVRRFGAVGVFAGTLVSTTLTAFLLEPVLLFRDAFRKSAGSFLKEYTAYPVISAILCAGTWFVGTRIDASDAGSMLFRGIAVLLLANLSILMLYGKSERFAAVWRVLCRPGKKKVRIHDISPHSVKRDCCP